MNQCTKALSGDRLDIIDFINYVFSQANRPHDFKALIPKVYADHLENLGAEHYIVKENNRIKALVAKRSITVSVADTVLKLGLIGSVSVHPYSRGKGYMKQLMNQVIDEARKDNTDMLILGGQRQRYGYFGFENAGTRFCYNISKANVRHGFSEIDSSEITFRELNADDIDYTLTLYNKRPLHALRDKSEYLDIMHNWESDCRVIYKNGIKIGYSCGGFSELILEDEKDFATVAKALFEQDNLEEATVPVSPFETERSTFLAGICESVAVKQVEMVNVLCWERVLRAFLNLKSGYTELLDGRQDFLIDNECIRINVTDGIPYVSKVCETHDTLKLSHNVAEKLFFGMESLLITEKHLKNWAPLPFTIDMPDCF